MAFFEGSCGVGGGTGLVDGGVDQGPWLQERVGGGGVGDGSSKPREQVQGRGQGRVGLAVRGGARAFGCGGVGGRDTGPQGRSKFRNVCRILVVLTRTKKKKNGVF